jgi:hypothetical protein
MFFPHLNTSNSVSKSDEREAPGRNVRDTPILAHSQVATMTSF